MSEYIHREKFVANYWFTHAPNGFVEPRRKWVIHDYYWHMNGDVLCLVRGPFNNIPRIKKAKGKRQAYTHRIVCKYVIESSGKKRPFTDDDLSKVPNRQEDIISSRDPADFWDHQPEGIDEIFRWWF